LPSSSKTTSCKLVARDKEYDYRNCSEGIRVRRGKASEEGRYSGQESALAIRNNCNTQYVKKKKKKEEKKKEKEA
jgi:hypothetical protein